MTFLGSKYIFKKIPLTVGIQVKGTLKLTTKIYYQSKIVKVLSIMEGSQSLQEVTNSKIAVRLEGITLKELETTTVLIGGELPLTFTDKEKEEYASYLYHLP